MKSKKKKLLGAMFSAVLAISVIATGALYGCGGESQVTAEEWHYATALFNMRNSSFTYASDYYTSADKGEKIGSITATAKLTETDIYYAEKTDFVADNKTDREFTRYYTLEYGQWLSGDKPPLAETYTKNFVDTDGVVPFNVIKMICGDLSNMINSKYSSVTFSGGIYSYKLGDADINVKLTEGKKNFKTRYCNIEQAEFKITREIDGKECYEEGVVKFSDYNATQVKTPNEIHLNSFCLDYVINSPTKTTYNSADHHAGEIFSLEKYLYYNYMEENDYSIISIRPGVIYFGGQMSTDILELPYTVRKEGKDFYLDVESNVISDIKCSPNSESQVRYGIDIDGNDPYIRPISDYTGKGLRDLNGSLSFKVNGAEYNAHVSREISLVFDAAGTHTDNQKPLCMFYTPQSELNDSNGTSPLGSPFNHIYRTNKNTFAIVLDTSDGTNGYYDIVPVISDLNNSKYYGKAFFATSVIVANTENIPIDADKFFTATVGGENKTFSFAMVENADGIPYIELRNYSDFEPAQIDLSFVKAEGKVKYYTVSAE